MARKIFGAGRNGAGVIMPWEKGICPNPAGRPRKIALQLKHEGYKVCEIMDTIEKLGALTNDELIAFGKNKNITVVEKGVIKMINDFFNKGKNEFLEYLIPKKMQKIVVENKIVNYEIPDDGISASQKYQDLMNK